MLKFPTISNTSGTAGTGASSFSFGEGDSSTTQTNPPHVGDLRRRGMTHERSASTLPRIPLSRVVLSNNVAGDMHARYVRQFSTRDIASATKVDRAHRAAYGDYLIRPLPGSRYNTPARLQQVHIPDGLSRMLAASDVRSRAWAWNQLAELKTLHRGVSLVSHLEKLPQLRPTWDAGATGGLPGPGNIEIPPSLAKSLEDDDIRPQMDNFFELEKLVRASCPEVTADDSIRATASLVIERGYPDRFAKVMLGMRIPEATSWAMRTRKTASATQLMPWSRMRFTVASDTNFSWPPTLVATSAKSSGTGRGALNLNRSAGTQ